MGGNFDLDRLPEEVARFYAAEVLLAFEHMHNQDIVYRDLKASSLTVHCRDAC